MRRVGGEGAEAGWRRCRYLPSSSAAFARRCRWSLATTRSEQVVVLAMSLAKRGARYVEDWWRSGGGLVGWGWQCQEGELLRRPPHLVDARSKLRDNKRLIFDRGHDRAVEE